MSYIHCPNCGQKALSVATRCPRCGVAFELQHGPHHLSPPARRIPVGVLIAGAVVVILVLDAVRRDVHFTPPSGPPAAVVDSSPVAEPTVTPRAPSTPAITDSTPAPPRLPAQEVARAAARDSAQHPKPARVAEPASPQTLGHRYARTWVNVRVGPRPSAAVTRILRPGERVEVDSLTRGWYLVLADGERLGYVDGGYLNSSPPPRRP